MHLNRSPERLVQEIQRAVEEGQVIVVSQEEIADAYGVPGDAALRAKVLLKVQELCGQTHTTAEYEMAQGRFVFRRPDTED